MGTKTAGLTPAHIHGGGNGTGTIRVKGPGEKYGQQRLVAKHVKTGEPILVGGEPVETLCQAERALLGCYFKMQARKGGVKGVRWDAHDEELWQELVNEHEWVEHGGDTDEPKIISGERVKALLDDSVSGGSTLNPVVLDDAIFSTLLISSELAPFVDMRDVAKGRTIRTGLVGRAVATWGVPDSSPTPLFDTTNLIGSVDTTVFDLKGAVEYGNDLASDISLNVGDLLQQGLGEKMAQQLDQAIALGDGVSQPVGLFNSAGLTVVPASNPGGPLAIADLEALIYSLPKPYRTALQGACFVGNDINFRRAKTIPVGTGFNERVFGMNTQDYSVFGFPYRLAPDVPNNKLMFVSLRRYRLFRRLGVSTRIVNDGRELTLRNVSLVFGIARFGGRLLDATGAAVVTDLPA